MYLIIHGAASMRIPAYVSCCIVAHSVRESVFRGCIAHSIIHSVQLMENNMRGDASENKYNYGDPISMVFSPV